jgi:hypothetical protein
MSKTVIAIPYRNRKAHLDYYLEHTVPLLIKHIPNVHIVIVEQSDDGQLFNRGKLLNIVFKEYQTDAIYVITQDVDVNPLESTILNYYAQEVPENTVLGILNSESNTLGGIIKCKLSTMITCNGFPNDYWGWGVEDKALQNRCEFYGVHIHKNFLANSPSIAAHFTIFNDIDDRHISQNVKHNTQIQYHIFSQLHPESQEEVIKYSGLTTLTYSILSRLDISDYVTHLIVTL